VRPSRLAAALALPVAAAFAALTAGAPQARDAPGAAAPPAGVSADDPPALPPAGALSGPAAPAAPSASDDQVLPVPENRAAATAAGRAAAAAAGLDAARARLAAATVGAPGREGGLPDAEFARALREMEAALAELREGIAGAEGELRAIAHDLRRDDAEIKRLIAALVSASGARAATSGASARGLHPEGAIAAARAAAMLEPAEAALRSGGAALAERLATRGAAERLRREGEETLARGLADAAAARARLEAIAQARRPAGPPDPASEAARLAGESDSLGDLARALGPRTSPATEAVASAAVARLAALGAGSDAAVIRSTRSPSDLNATGFEPPVAGRVRLGFGEADGAGVARPGLTFAAAPRAVVTAPAGGVVRYAGPFLDWRGVVVLAVDSGETVLLAGLDEMLVEAGERLAMGAPLGLLGGRALDAQEFLMLPAQGTDAIGEETLYMELWRAEEPVDPGPVLDAGGAEANG
jgi:murein hydrolase activator